MRENEVDLQRDGGKLAVDVDSQLEQHLIVGI